MCRKKDTKNGKCNTPRFNKELLENNLLAILINFIFTKECIQTWTDAILKAYAAIPKMNNIDVLKQQLNKVKTQKERLLDLYLNSEIDKGTYNTKMNSLLTNISKIESEILYVESSHNFTKEELVLAINLMIEDLKKDATILCKKGIVNTFIKKISIDNESIDIELKLPHLKGAYNVSFGDLYGVRTHECCLERAMC